MEYQTFFEERAFSAEKRKELAKSGAALPDGSYPIENKEDLKNAIQAIGRASSPAAAKAHVKKRAKALGASDLLPDTWESWYSKEGEVIVEATYCSGDSHDGLRSKLSAAIDGKVQAGQDMDGDNDGAQDAVDRQNAGYPLHYVQQVHDKHVIYSMGGKHFAHGYEKDGEGDPHLKGEPKEVEHSFSTVTPAKESFEESFALEQSYRQAPLVAGAAEQIVESYDAAKGELTMTIIKPGWSLNGRHYSADMLRRDHKVFENAKMFADHATDKESSARPEGSVNNWVAQMGRVWAEHDGTVKGSAVVIDPQFKQKLAALAEHKMLDKMGVSIRAVGKASDGEIDGKRGKIIEGITAARSVDFVTFAGAGGAVTELQ